MRGRPLLRLGGSVASPASPPPLSPSPEPSAGAGLGFGGRPLLRFGWGSASPVSSGFLCNSGADQYVTLQTDARRVAPWGVALCPSWAARRPSWLRPWMGPRLRQQPRRRESSCFCYPAGDLSCAWGAQRRGLSSYRGKGGGKSATAGSSASRNGRCGRDRPCSGSPELSSSSSCLLSSPRSSCSGEDMVVRGEGGGITRWVGERWEKGNGPSFLDDKSPNTVVARVQC